MDGGASGFSLPVFYSYPPYFTVQPVKETRDKQCALWGDLLLAYCRHNKIFVVNSDDESFPLFSNPAINRRLTVEAQRLFLDYLVQQGNAEWLDTAKRQCLMLWKKIPEWAASIHGFAKMYGLSESVMTLDELNQGDDVKGTELQGLHRAVLTRALRLLESQGKARLFSGATPDEEGVKFL